MTNGQMTDEQILEAQLKIKGLFNCPKCKDRKWFINRDKQRDYCREC